MTNPYKPPSATTSEAPPQASLPFQTNGAPFRRAINHAWRKSKGHRADLIGSSVALWVPVAIMVFFLSSSVADGGLGPLGLLLFVLVVVLPVFGRIVALSITSKYLNIVREKPTAKIPLRVALLTAPLLAFPVFLGFCSASFLMALLEFAGGTNFPFVDWIVALLIVAPLVGVLPWLWASNPFWVDGNGLLEGLRNGWRFLRAHRSGSLETAFVLLIMGGGTLFVSIAFPFFDFISKAAFAEAYRVATSDPAPDDDEAPNSQVVMIAELKRLRGDKVDEEE